MNKVELEAINCLSQTDDDGDEFFLWYHADHPDKVLLDLHAIVVIGEDEFPFHDRFELPKWVMMQ